MGNKSSFIYFIERLDTHEWYCGKSSHHQGAIWSNNPDLAFVFKSKSDANEYLKMSFDIPARLPCEVTEHLFLDPES